MPASVVLRATIAPPAGAGGDTGVTSSTGAIAGAWDATGPSAGPLAVAVTPQQARAAGSDRGPSVWCAQQEIARSSAPATPGFAYDTCTPRARITASTRPVGRRVDTFLGLTPRVSGAQVRHHLDPRARRSYVPLVSAASLGLLIEEFVRRPGLGPARRGLPCFGLESTTGTGSHLLDALAAHGIFRKYETVLAVAGGLGATGRWLAGRLGCTAVVTASDTATAITAARLTRLAKLRGRVSHVPAAPGALPFGTARFTHVWAVDVLSDLADAHGALVEAFRVVRPGGHVAVQELVPAAGEAVGSRAGTPFVAADAWRDALVAAGFVDVGVQEVNDVAEHSAQVTAARQQFAARLGASTENAPEAALRRRLGDALAAGRLRVAQLVARRP